MEKPFSVILKEKFGEYEVRDAYDDFCASFRCREHAKTWAKLMKGGSYIVDREPPKIQGKQNEKSNLRLHPARIEQQRTRLVME